MKRAVIAILILVVAAECFLLTSTASAQDLGELAGAVSNGTTGELVPGALVNLDIFQRMTKVATRQTTTDDDGRFRFEGLPVGPTIRYIPATTYKEVVYTTKRAIDPTVPGGPVTLSVYETIESAQDLAILRAAIAVPSINEHTALIQVLEVITFINRGKHAYIGRLSVNDKRGVLRVPLPDDALDFSHDREAFGPGGPIRTANGIMSVRPVPPGEFVLVYAYKLPFTTSTRTISRTFAYPVDSATFLIPTEGPHPDSSVLTNMATVDVNGVLNFRLSGTDIPAGERVPITLGGLPEIVLPQPDQRTPASPSVRPNDGVALDTAFRGIAVGLLIVLTAGAALYTVTSRRSHLTVDGSGTGRIAPGAEPLEAERLWLIGALADLDESSEAGQILDTEYQPARRAAKQRLTDIMLLINERSKGH